MEPSYNAPDEEPPRLRNPAAEPDGSPEKQRELKLNTGIAAIAAVLCVFVTIIFFVIESMLPAIIFAVITLVCVGILVRVLQRMRSARRS